MRKIVLIATFLIAGNFLGAQTLGSLKSEVESFQKAHYNMFFEGIASQSYPKMVDEIGGGAKFSTVIDSEFQDNQVGKRWQIENPQYIFGKIIEDASGKYVLITFRNPVRYFYENKLATAEIETNVKALKLKRGAKEVFYEPNRNTINVKQNTRFLAIADDSTTGKWKFINLDEPSQLEFANRIFSKDLRTKIGF